MHRKLFYLMILCQLGCDWNLKPRVIIKFYQIDQFIFSSLVVMAVTDCLGRFLRTERGEPRAVNGRL